MKQQATHTSGPLEICGATHLWSPTSKANIASCSALRTIAHVGYAPPEIGDIDEVAANARRIAACWNALEGIDTEAVERYRQTAPALKQEHLERQRDVLLSAAEFVVQNLPGALSNSLGKTSYDEGYRASKIAERELVNLRAAIAAIKPAEWQPFLPDPDPGYRS